MDISIELNTIVNEAKKSERFLYRRSVPKRILKKALKAALGGNRNDKIGICGFKEDISRCGEILKELNKNVVHTEYFRKSDLVCSPNIDFNGEEQLKNLAHRDDIDILLVTSYFGCRVAEMYLFSYEAKFKIIDLYDYINYHLNIKMIICPNPYKIYLKKIIIKFYTIYSMIKRDSGSANTNRIGIKVAYWKKRMHPVDNYDGIYAKRNFYEVNEDAGLKAYYLRELIHNYVAIRDIKSALNYIEKYIESDFPLKEQYQTLKQKLDSLVEDIKNNLQAREDDILVYWVDSVSYKEFREYNFLRDKRKDGICFTNTYTHIPYTHTTMQTMLTGLPFFEGELYKYTETEDDVPFSKVLDYLEAHGYNVLEVSNNYIQNKYVLEPDIAIKYQYMPSACNIWAVIRKVLLEPEKKYFAIIHCDCEPHHPYWGGDLKQMRVGSRSFFASLPEYGEQIKSALAYLDGQISWYDLLWGLNTKIYLSDHGKGNPAYSEDRLHAFCLLTGRETVGKEEPRIFSYLNFGKLIHYIIEPSATSYDAIFSEEALIQNEDPYGENYIHDIISKYDGDLPKIRDNYREWMQYRGVIKGHYKFLRFANGQEVLIDIANEKELDMGEKSHMEIATFLRNLSSGPYANLDENHYMETRKLYQMLGIKIV